MARKYAELRSRLSPEAQARAAARAEAAVLTIRLQELRLVRNLSQTAVAKLMSIEQTAISKLERRDDMYVSTLRAYVKALGGELKLVASFPDGEMQIQPLEPIASRKT